MSQNYFAYQKLDNAQSDMSATTFAPSAPPYDSYIHDNKNNFQNNLQNNFQNNLQNNLQNNFNNDNSWNNLTKLQKLDYYYKKYNISPWAQEDLQNNLQNNFQNNLQNNLQNNFNNDNSWNNLTKLQKLDYYKKYNISPWAQEDLQTLVNYDIVIICDDSSSMREKTEHGTRWSEFYMKLYVKLLNLVVY